MINTQSIFVLLSIGSNIGDRKGFIDKGIEKIIGSSILNDLTISGYYETEPVGYKNQNWFLNIALSGYTKLSAVSLFKNLKIIEYIIGRQDREKWHERELDIDILLFGGEIINTPDLIIPHPRMQERGFVLVPANEIAGDIYHPVLQISIKNILADCPDTSIVKKITI